MNLLTCLLLALSAAAVSQAPASRPDAPRAVAVAPSPLLGPGQVIGLQLAALRHNDEPNEDDGIRTAFRFASPGNREVTGPIGVFIELVKNPLYAPLIDHQKADRGPVSVEGDTAQQLVRVVGPDGEEAAYLFQLGRQRGGEYDRCWMTEGVMRVGEPPAAPEPPKQVI